MANLSTYKSKYSFDVNDYQESYDALPIGEYVAVIAETEERENSNKNGKLISVQLQIVEGQFENRVLYDNLNIENPNDMAVEIAFQTIANISKACGFDQIPESTEEWHGKKLIVKVGVQKNDPTRNQIKAYKKYKGQVSNAQPSQASESSASTPPWKK